VKGFTGSLLNSDDLLEFSEEFVEKTHIPPEILISHFPLRKMLGGTRGKRPNGLELSGAAQLHRA
jgi:hypothetical protein